MKAVYPNYTVTEKNKDRILKSDKDNNDTNYKITETYVNL